VTASPAEMRHRRYALKWTEMTEIVPAPISLFSIAGTFNDPSRRSRRRSRIEVHVCRKNSGKHPRPRKPVTCFQLTYFREDRNYNTSCCSAGAIIEFVTTRTMLPFIG